MATNDAPEAAEISTSGPDRAKDLRGTALVAAGLLTGQVLAYALVLAGARFLGPAQFSALASMLALALIVNVAALAIQAVAARTIVLCGPSEREHAGAGILRVTLWASAITAAATAVLAPLLSPLLHMDGWGPVLLVAASMFPLTVFGAQFGLAQGHESHARLGAIYAIYGLGRAGGGIIGMLATGSVIGALAGIAVGGALAAVFAQLLVSVFIRSPRLALPGFPVQVLHTAHALVALFVLTNIDVLLARAFLPAEQAGQYSVGAIVAKVAFWLPQFVGVVAFPRMADQRRGSVALLASGVVAFIGACVVLGTLLLPGLVVQLVGGAQYEQLTSVVWIFAAEGALFSLTQFLLYSRIAIDDRSAVVVLWAGALAILGATVIWHGSIEQIVLNVVSVALGVCVIGTGVLIHEQRSGGGPAGLGPDITEHGAPA